MFEFRGRKICEFREFFDAELTNEVIFTPQANVKRSPLLTELEI